MVAVSVHSTEITTFTELADLDLSGTYDYAINMGGTWNHADVVLGSATFVDHSVSSDLTVTYNGNFLASQYGYATLPVYSPNDNSLSALMHHVALVYGGAPSQLGLSVDVTAGRQYELKMFFSENYYSDANTRSFDISVEGTLIADDFIPIPAEADWSGGTAPHTGVLVTHQFTAGDSVLNMDLTPGAIGDGNPHISGFTLEDVTPPVLLATVSTFTGGDLGEGLDLNGEYVYTVDVAGDQYSSAVQGFTFADDEIVDGVTVTLGGSVNSMETYWKYKTPEYGVSSDDNQLEAMMAATAVSSGTDPSITVDLDVIAGQTYELQLFFSEAEYTTANARVFDIVVEDTLIAEKFTTIPAEAAGWSPVPDVGVLVTYEFVAGDSVASVVLTNGTSAVIQGIALKDVTSPIRGTIIMVN